MAGAAFEGLRDIVQPDADAPYVPGIPDTSMRLADAFIDAFFRYDWGEVPWLESEATYARLIREHGSLDQHLFIDSLLLRFAERRIEQPYLHLTDLLTPAVRALYSQGYDEFSLNLAHLQERPDKALSCIRGTEERPISLLLHGDVEEVGCGLTHCIVDFYGNARDVGESASFSEFRLHAASGHVGRGAQGCAFLFPRAYYAEVSAAGSPKSGGYTVNLWYWGPEESRTVVIERKDRSKKSGDFFEQGNRILIPDGNGGWREVRP